jgi:hypothetical protein
MPVEPRDQNFGLLGGKSAIEAIASPQIESKHSKSFIFGPGTLTRTWGTRQAEFGKLQIPETGGKHPR